MRNHRSVTAQSVRRWGTRQRLIKSIDIPLSNYEVRYEEGALWKNRIESWGFLRQGKKRHSAKKIAEKFIRINQKYLGLENVFSPKGPNDPVLKYVQTIRGLAGQHVIYRQVIKNDRLTKPLHRAFVTVHINSDKQVYMCKSRAMPKHILEQTDVESTRKTKEKQIVNMVLGWILDENSIGPSADIPFGPPYPVVRENLKVGKPSQYDDDAENSGLPHAATKIPTASLLLVSVHLCWAVPVARVAPKEEWLIYVLANGEFLSAEKTCIAHSRKKYESIGNAYVYDPNPVTALRGHEKLIQQDLLAEPQVEGRQLQGRLRTAPEKLVVACIRFFGSVS